MDYKLNIKVLYVSLRELRFPLRGFDKDLLIVNVKEPFIEEIRFLVYTHRTGEMFLVVYSFNNQLKRKSILKRIIKIHNNVQVLRSFIILQMTFTKILLNKITSKYYEIWNIQHGMRIDNSL